MQIRCIVLGLKETKELMNALRSYDKYPAELIAMKTELARCIEESVNQEVCNYNLNILCRFTEGSYKETVEREKGFIELSEDMRKSLTLNTNNYENIGKEIKKFNGDRDTATSKYQSGELTFEEYTALLDKGL